MSSCDIPNIICPLIESFLRNSSWQLELSVGRIYWINSEIALLQEQQSTVIHLIFEPASYPFTCPHSALTVSRNITWSSEKSEPWQFNSCRKYFWTALWVCNRPLFTGQRIERVLSFFFSEKCLLVPEFAVAGNWNWWKLMV